MTSKLILAFMPGVLLYPLTQATTAPADGFQELAVKWGPWAAIALTLGGVLLQSWRRQQVRNEDRADALETEIKTVRDAHQAATDGLLLRATVALEKHAERIDRCPAVAARGAVNEN